MTKSTKSALEEALRRNRQRLAFDQLATEAPWLIREVADVVSAERSQRLEAEIRERLAVLRPQERGVLVVSRDVETLRNAALNYFDERKELRFHVFLAHWTDAGALVFEGAYLRQHVSDIVALDGDTVYGSTEDVRDVFAVDRTLEDDEVTFEFFWSSLA